MKQCFKSRAMASISSYLMFCDAVLAAASKNYRVNLFTPALMQSTNSVAFERGNASGFVLSR